MAEERVEKDEEDEELELDGAIASSKKKLILMISGAVVALLVIIGGTVGVTLMMSGGDSSQAGEAGEADDEKVVLQDAIYVPVKTMTVNFADKGAAKFLQIHLNIMTYDPEIVELVNTHMPVIRNDMLNLLGTQTYKEISTAAGKEALRVKLLLIVQKILMEQEEREGVEAIYFTKMIMQ